jgi:hypothetical protein
MVSEVTEERIIQFVDANTSGMARPEVPRRLTKIGVQLSAAALPAQSAED